MMRARAEKVERSFQHLLDHGGGRRTTLRGHHNIGKRLLAMAFVFNVALFRRNACGYGTVKQHLAGNRWMETFLALMRVMWTGLRRLATASSRTKLLWPASPQLFKSLELLSLRTCARSVFRGFQQSLKETDREDIATTLRAFRSADHRSIPTPVRLATLGAVIERFFTLQNSSQPPVAFFTFREEAVTWAQSVAKESEDPEQTDFAKRLVGYLKGWGSRS